MKNIIANTYCDSLLPAFGEKSTTNNPIWDEAQKMFIFNQYESNAGHRYYSGVRLSNQLLIVERSGLWNTWHYLNSIELYRYNGKGVDLIQKHTYDKVFHNADFVRSESEKMLMDYFKGQLKLTNKKIGGQQLKELAAKAVADSYKSFLDSDYALPLIQVIPALEQKY